ncbi:ribbon-helix-helix domain-containing protein [Salinigranum sp. GCM10025319]|uniref:ribbon-helix-helix domain-containing protein n=1 Tax=Salinigranum sp. GCM10025319 TaxID=3252687 RepID=UPI0036206688
MALSVNVTVSMPPEMVDEIDDAKGKKSRSQYIRELIREAENSPFIVSRDTDTVEA